MAALFPRWTNTAYALALVAIAATISTLVVAPMIFVRTPYGTGQDAPITQPVDFDHRHHARDDGIDCMYCHPGAERTANAGIPPTEVCMGCHGQIWQDSRSLALVRESWLNGTAIPWVRVYDLPDHVYFHHGVHVQAGITCRNCHGAVENMARVMRVPPLTMSWCLDCHRDPPGPAENGRRITPITTCSACHR